MLPGYDAIALAYVEHPLRLRRIAFGSFSAYALSHSLGFPLLSGGSVRYRFWSVWGLSTSENELHGESLRVHSLKSLVIAGPMIQRVLDQLVAGGYPYTAAMGSKPKPTPP